MPIKRIISSINRGGKTEPHLAIDYDTLIGKIEETYDKKSELEHQFKQQLHSIRSNFMKKLLMNTYRNQGEIDRMQEVLNIRWKSEWFNVLLIRIDDFAPLTEQGDGYRPDLVRLIIVNIAEELFNQRHQAFSYEEEGQITLLVNYGDLSEADMYQETADLMKQLIQFIGDRFRIDLSAGAGNVCRGLSGVPGAWAEAKLALSQRLLHGKHSLTMYRDIPLSSNSYYYPMDLELQIMNHVRIGDAEGAERLLDRIYEENYVNRRLPVYLVNCLFFDMVGTIVKVLDGVQANHEEVFGENADMVATLMQCDTVDEMHQEIKEILRKVCVYLLDRRESNNNDLRDRMMAYIEAHYSDKELSLLVAADYLGMSNSYLSRFFKDHTGYNFIDYVTRLRIQRAKDLLSGTDLSITEIADKVGYGSANSFIRSFKKLESITPGQFKEGR
ncbi:helix-turn-helix domain-containing protein [Cohnella ginsengisoli]|uniref:Helix-turn-helix domain-containing protein n=1 Tax=Cohnella ginsengisoli TaxID=425004 RepID=A0A9X4QPE4_9BACL|nr:helix-turn-helix domain-containing protein [Cohnella ginsengisoli]MDG0792650.1 helix-turn-helix domain-containing protein [Cohnella ginsengisoli]